MTDSEKHKLIRNVKAEVRGALLRRWCEDADLIYNVRHTLDPSDPLAAEIFTLGKDAAWIRELPEDSDEGIHWEQRRPLWFERRPARYVNGREQTFGRDRRARERQADFLAAQVLKSLTPSARARMTASGSDPAGPKKYDRHRHAVEYVPHDLRLGSR